MLVLCMVCVACMALRTPSDAPQAALPSEYFRVLEWNVSDSDWVKHRDASRTVLRHADSGILVLVQVAGGLNAGDVRHIGLITPPALGAMQRANAVRDDGLTDWTWDGRGTQFDAGRLDNVAYSSGTLAVVRGRVWDTESMAPETLSFHHLTAETSRSINRHRPVVVDFRLVP